MSVDSMLAPHISTNVETFISEHIRESYPDLISFISAYFDYLETEHKSGLYQNTIPEQRDVSLVFEEFLPALKAEFGKYFPSALINEERLLSIIVDLYKYKGTVSGIDVLFRIFFNEEVVISFPKDNMLRVSDGRWNQHCFITVETEKNINYLEFASKKRITSIDPETGFVYYDIPIDYIEVITSAKVRLFFKVIYSDYFSKDYPVSIIGDIESSWIQGSILETIDYDDGEIIDLGNIKETIEWQFTTVEEANSDKIIVSISGNVIESPSGVVIAQPGKNWKVGQVMIIPGTQKNTLARITSIDAEGAILDFEIIEYGYEHEKDQFITASPYKIKPSSINYNIESVITDTDPLTIHHTLSINDETMGFTDRCTGDENGVGVFDEVFNTNGIVTIVYDNYFLYDYNIENYAGGSILVYINKSPTTIDDSNVSIEEWFNSRAIIGLLHSDVSKTKGSFLTTDGIISDPESIIQDNYFYQLFSYVVESDLDITQYREIIRQTHPAGLKFFADLQKKVKFIVDEFISAYRTKDFEIVYIHEVIDAISEFQDMLFIKVLNDEAIINEQPALFFTKETFEESVNIDGGEVINIITQNTSYGEIDYSEDYFQKYYTTTLTIG